VTDQVWVDDDALVKGRLAFDGWHSWRYGQDRKTGQPFFIIDGSEPGTTWYAAPNDCTCPDRTYRRRVCKHMVAVRLWCGALLDGRIDTKIVTATERRALFAEMAMAYDLDTAEQADSLLEAYERTQAQADEALVEEDWGAYDREVAAPEPERVDNVSTDEPDPLAGWPEPTEYDGRPVWLSAGDTWAPDTSLAAATRRPVSRPEPTWVVVGRRVETLLAEAGRLSAPDPRDEARHRRQTRVERRGRAPRSNHPAGGTSPRPLRSYNDLFLDNED
jgi:hypothetical protein